MQAKIMSWLVFLGTSALCLTLWLFTGEMQRLMWDSLEGYFFPALTKLILNHRWVLLCLPLPWLLAAVITSLRREPAAMPAVIGVLVAVAGGACLAFWVVLAMALPFVDLVMRLGA
jgi:hypothetical protein